MRNIENARACAIERKEAKAAAQQEEVNPRIQSNRKAALEMQAAKEARTAPERQREQIGSQTRQCQLMGQMP